MTPEMQAFATRIRIMTDNLEEYSHRRRAQDPADESALVNTLGLVEFIRMSDLYHDREEICARLRANALLTQHFSPVITSYQEAIADELNPRSTN